MEFQRHAGPCAYGGLRLGCELLLEHGFASGAAPPPGGEENPPECARMSWADLRGLPAQCRKQVLQPQDAGMPATIDPQLPVYRCPA